jgi:hypothetical protein
VKTTSSFYEIEQELYNIYKPKFENTLPSKSAVKKAYIWHCESMFNTLNNSKYSKGVQVLPEEKTFFMLLERVRLDDELFYKFGYSFTQIKYLLHYYNLYEDKDVLDWYKTIDS